MFDVVVFFVRFSVRSFLHPFVRSVFYYFLFFFVQCFSYFFPPSRSFVRSYLPFVLFCFVLFTFIFFMFFVTFFYRLFRSFFRSFFYLFFLSFIFSLCFRYFFRCLYLFIYVFCYLGFVIFFRCNTLLCLFFSSVSLIRSLATASRALGLDQGWVQEPAGLRRPRRGGVPAAGANARSKT